MPGSDVLDPGHRHRRERLAAVVLLALLAVPAAAGAWSATGGGAGATRATSLPAGQQPLAVGAVTSVSVTWAAGPVPGTRYVVRRYSATSGAAGTVNGTCAGIVSTTSCTDTGVPLGGWRYAITPVLGSWSGPESPYSPLVTITL